MSGRATAWAWEVRLSGDRGRDPLLRLALLYLADAASDDGELLPAAFHRFELACCMTGDQLRALLDQLAELGLLTSTGDIHTLAVAGWEP